MFETIRRMVVTIRVRFEPAVIVFIYSYLDTCIIH